MNTYFTVGRYCQRLRVGRYQIARKFSENFIDLHLLTTACTDWLTCLESTEGLSLDCHLPIQHLTVPDDAFLPMPFPIPQ